MKPKFITVLLRTISIWFRKAFEFIEIVELILFSNRSWESNKHNNKLNGDFICLFIENKHLMLCNFSPFEGNNNDSNNNRINDMTVDSYAVLLQNSSCGIVHTRRTFCEHILRAVNYIILSKLRLMCAFCSEFVLSNVYMCCSMCMCAYLGYVRFLTDRLTFVLLSLFIAKSYVVGQTMNEKLTNRHNEQHNAFAFE